MIAAGTSRAPGRSGRAGALRRWWWRHPEGLTVCIALAAWAAVVVNGHGHSGQGWLRLQAGWLLMVMAMMLPPALPMTRHVIQNSKRYRRQRAGLLFAGSSLLVWVGAGGLLVGLSAYAAAFEHRRWLLGGSLLLAALWELTPHKKRAVKACHRTIPLPPDGGKADRACMRLGLRYGNAGFKSCWALMLPMALVHPAGVALMLLLTAIAVVEEAAVKGYRLAPGAAVLLVVAGLMVLVLG